MQKAPEFWWRPETGAAALALWPVSRVWGAAAALRLGREPAFRPPVPVICVGNFVVGGAGKTPTAIALARGARGRGLRPGILASGYGGRVKAPVTVDTARHSAAEVGDEALLLAEAVPTVVASDRAAGAKRLLDGGVNFIVMDDGFQNPSLAKDFSLIAVDAGSGVGNGAVIPSGPLRAPLDMQLRAADSLLVIGEGAPGEAVIRAAARAGRPVMRGVLKPTRIMDWRRRPVLAYAGIGRPQKFFDTLKETRVEVAQTRTFPDHHVYAPRDARELLSAAAAADLRLVTTEKDLVRLKGATGQVGELRDRSEAFQVALQFDNATAVAELIDETLKRAAHAAGGS